MLKNTKLWRDLTIGEKEAGWRLDVFLSRRFSKYSRSMIRNYIREGLVCSESRSLKPSSILMLGEKLRIYVPGLAPSTPPPALPDILYEDHRLLVVNKPAGMLVHPAGDTFAWALIGLFKKARMTDKIDLIHRLDRDTSGVLLLSKDVEASIFLKQQFAERNVQKVYRAISRGVATWEEKEAELPIGKDIHSEINLRRAVSEAGVYAHSTFRVLQRMDEYSLIECILHTGRTHQIRVHLDALGFPLLGDKIYGQEDEIFLHYLQHGASQWIKQTLRFPRHALHAFSLQVPHPEGDGLYIEAPLPKDMQEIIDGNPPKWSSEQ